MTMRPLDGIRVIDLSQGPAGGFATMVLADFGADVIKVERPGGDPFRALAGAPLWLRGKCSVELDLGRAGSHLRLHELCEGADVVVVSPRPGGAARFGCDYPTLSARNPALVHCEISGFGAEGPCTGYAGYDGVVAARSGRMMAFSGQLPRPGPAFAALPVSIHAAAQAAVQGIVAGLIARECSGRGMRVETSLLRALLPYDLIQLPLVQLAEREPARFGALPELMGRMPTLNYHPVKTRDGRWIQLANLLEHHFYAFLDAVGLLGEMLGDARFQGAPETWSAEATEEARDRILRRMQERSAAEWMEIFHKSGNVAAEPYTSAQQALDHPDLVANGDVVEHEHPRLGRVRQIGPIAELGATPGRAGRPAPASGEHTGVVLLAERRAPPSLDAGSPLPRGRPLAGVTILELATIIAAPLGVSMLADLGARVIKVEPIGGDPYRKLGPAGVMASKTNAGKESISIDLKVEAGGAILRELVQRADVLVHNYRPGVPERLGIGYEQARALRPDIVWVSANGYGPRSPSAARPSAHPVPGAVAGGALYQAGTGCPPECFETLEELRETARRLSRANEPNPDPNTSVVVASATLLALLARARFGVGQPVFVNMLVANAYANGDDFLAYEGKPARPAVDPELMGPAATYRLYAAREGFVFLALCTDAEWAAFCTAVRREDLLRDPRFATAAARRANDEALASELGRLFRGDDAGAWERLLAPDGIGCVRADATTPGAFFASDPHALANDLAPIAPHARFGALRRWGPIVTCDGGAESYGAAPLAGQHTDALLAELGHSPDEVRRLRAQGVVWSEQIQP